MKWFHKIQQTLQTYDYMYLKRPKIEYKNFCFNKLHILFKWGKCVTNFIWPNQFFQLKKFLIANCTISDLSRGGEGLIDLIALVPVNHGINSTPRLSVEMSWKRLLRSITDYKI